MMVACHGSIGNFFDRRQRSRYLSVVRGLVAFLLSYSTMVILSQRLRSADVQDWDIAGGGVNGLLIGGGILTALLLLIGLVFRANPTPSVRNVKPLSPIFWIVATESVYIAVEQFVYFYPYRGGFL